MRERRPSAFYRARYYNQSLGRFFSRDPIFSLQSLYSYCNNSPTNFTDPTGLWTNPIDPFGWENPSYWIKGYDPDDPDDQATWELFKTLTEDGDAAEDQTDELIIVRFEDPDPAAMARQLNAEMEAVLWQLFYDDLSASEAGVSTNDFGESDEDSGDDDSNLSVGKGMGHMHLGFDCSSM